jgi:two-component system cell cycle sensor histidine kinase/response regulator CckA
MGEMQDIKDRLQSLATAKSRYQLVVDILTELIEIGGLDNIVHYMIHTIMDTWGGTNVILYYKSDNIYYRNDIYEEKKALDSLDDPLVEKCWKEGEFLELLQDEIIPIYKDQLDFSGDQKVWLFPLGSDNEIIALIKIDGIILSHLENVRNDLKIIMGYFAIILKNELMTTERLKKADQALQEQMNKRMEEQERYINIIESSFDGFWVADGEGRFLEVNDIYCSMSGYNRDELLSMNIPQVEALESVAETNEHMMQIKKTGKGRFETRQKCRDGSLIDVEVNCIYTESQGGRFYVFLRDVTEKNLLQEQYYQSQKVESIGRLAGGVAHDLNNLLTPILGYSEIMKSELQDHEYGEYTNEIFEAGIRAKDLVNQLLVFSKKQSLQTEMINLNHVIEEFRKLLRRTIREDISFQINLHSNLGFIEADLRQIEQVLMNLSVNAQDSMPQGGSLTIETDQLEVSKEDSSRQIDMKPGTYICLRVRDRGVGMDRETRKHIFEPFFSTKGELGTGLGLATVYGIITQHKGHIEVKSHLGEGTEFSIYFPLCSGTVVKKKENVSPGKPIKQQGNILLVEDNRQVLNLAREILTSRGYNIFIAENGKTGLEILKTCSEKIDLLLTDVVMPKMNGNKLYEKAREFNPHIKVLFMSGYNEESLPYSFDKDKDYLRKPFTLDNLISKVSHLINSTDPIEAEGEKHG